MSSLLFKDFYNIANSVRSIVVHQKMYMVFVPAGNNAGVQYFYTEQGFSHPVFFCLCTLCQEKG